MSYTLGDSETEDDNESVATEGDRLTNAESDGAITDAETKSEAALSEVERATPEPDVEQPAVVEEPQPPSPAPEELWTYLKEAVTSDAVISVDELVEKLVSTVTTIPQPYLKSVVKESIKKQKSIEEEESETHPAGESQPTVEGELVAPAGESVPAVDGAQPSENATLTDGAATIESPASAGGVPASDSAASTENPSTGEAPLIQPAAEAPSGEPAAEQAAPQTVEAAA